MSSNRRPWYKWWPKDFIADEKVQGLSFTAELLYRRVLDIMWQANDGLLLNNCTKLAHAIGKGLDSKSFEDAWNEIQTPGYELLKTTEDGKFLYSKRLLEQIRETGKISDLRASAAKAKQLQSKSKAIAKHLKTDTDTDIDTDNKRKNNKKENFNAFWNKWPTKIGKDAALKAWIKRSDLPEISIIIDAIQKQIDWRKNSNGKFRPEWKHPATWINQGCRSDECNPDYGRRDSDNNIPDEIMELIKNGTK